MKERGFTILGLVIVISITGLLTAALLVGSEHTSHNHHDTKKDCTAQAQ